MSHSKNIESNLFFVDEAGDLTLFDKKGKCIVGTEGVSNYFMLGVAKIENYTQLEKELNELRINLVNDPYFKGVPSIKLTEKQFHACKDLPEIRREVFKLIQQFDISVSICLERKKNLADFAKHIFITRKNKINEHDIYDDLTERIFRILLPKDDCDIIYFSRRGKTERTISLQKAINRAKINFQGNYVIPLNKPIRIISKYPYEVAGLQIIDYFLWAFQRMYEKNEDRFYNLLKDKYKMILDIHDILNYSKYGQWYMSSLRK